jgi:hypothetical protein
MVVKTFTNAGVLVGAALIGSCAAHADPLSFPDLSAYAPADVKDYEILVPNPGRTPLPTVYFLTPGNIVCRFTIDQASCTGNNLPSIPPAASNPEAGINRVNWIGTTSGLNQTSGAPRLVWLTDSPSKHFRRPTPLPSMASSAGSTMWARPRARTRKAAVSFCHLRDLGGCPTYDGSRAITIACRGGACNAKRLVLARFTTPRNPRRRSSCCHPRRWRSRPRCMRSSK